MKFSKETKKSGQKNIHIIAGKEYQLRIIDENSDISQDFFYDVYCNAFREVVKIVNENNNNYNKKDILETSNNIIAFCGERGQGKSSAMLSFSKLLKNIDKQNIKNHFLEYTNELRNKKFHILSRVDPTELENQQNILSVIISRIFFDFKEYLKNNQNDNLIMRNEILELFQQCYKDISLIKNNEFNRNEEVLYDDLEILSNLSDSSNIKNDFSKLVSLFLKFVDNKDLLVIQIDDTDLNVEKVYNIVEDIRKYFMIPNVIVLMATKLDQLIKAIEQGYMNSFSQLLTSKKLSFRDFHNMATKYIGKLMPGSRCIILPEITLSDFDITYNNLNLKYSNYSSSNDESNAILDGPLQDKVLEFIYRKTGIVFVKPQNCTHKIIPKTARELANFLSVLNGMENIKQVTSFTDLENKDIYLRLKNINEFEEYFLNTWIEENVEVTYIERLKNWSRSSWETKNKSVIFDISKTFQLFPNIYLNYYPRRQNRYYNYEYDLYDIKTETDSFNLSDVLDTLRKMDNYYPESRNGNFSFAIRVLYSITLNKLILKQILENSDYAISFIGDIYGNQVYSFMRKEFNKYNRAKFSFRLSNIDYIKLKKDMNELDEVLDALFIKKVNVEDNEIGGPIQCTFNITSPLINSLQPYNLLNIKTNDLFISDYKFETMRYACFQIISNIDILLKLNDELTSYSNNLPPTAYAAHIVDFYNRVYSVINSINFLPENTNPFETLFKLLERSNNWVNYIFKTRYTGTNTYINKYSKRLMPYQKTNTFELFRNRLEDTQEVFNEITEENIIDLTDENQEIRKMLDKIDSCKNLSDKTYLKRQTKINKMRKSALEKLINMED